MMLLDQVTVLSNMYHSGSQDLLVRIGYMEIPIGCVSAAT